MSLVSGDSGRWLVAWSSQNPDGKMSDHRDILYAWTPVDRPLELISPNGGEIWAGGALQSIRWKSNSLAVSQVRLELWNAGGRVADLGTDALPDVAPRDHAAQVYLPLLPAGADYKVRAVSTSDRGCEAASDQTFTITGKPICLRSPNGGEEWIVGTTQYITWESNPLIGGTSVRLELWRGQNMVKDLGSDWDPDGSHVMKMMVPFVPAHNDYRIRAVSSWDPALFDDSDKPLTIRSDPRNGSSVRTDWHLYD
ncbi:MAG: hypothetical protein M1457_09080 [bacterium]|nr:hypothetical protein [bacterium]